MTLMAVQYKVYRDSRVGLAKLFLLPLYVIFTSKVVKNV